jgi:glycosyltransferase involved in cell wall biosynthesis
LTPPRRILLVNYEYPPIGGGGGNATHHLAHELVKLGHHPFVLTAAWGGLPPAEFTHGVTIRRILALRRHADHCSIPEMLAFTSAALLAAPGWARQWKVEAALVFFTVPCGPIGWLLKRLLKLPYCLSLQGGDVPGFDPDRLHTYHTVAGPMISHLWHDAAAVIANSEGLADLAQRHDARARIGVIPAGADVEGIAPKSDYSAQQHVEFLFVGRMVKQKGLDVLFDAFGKLDHALDWRLTIVGEGPERSALTAQAARLNIAGRITFKAWTDRSALPGIYRNADVFVLPSRAEGMANALLDAMASGLPVIGTRVAGTAEVMTDEKTGLLVPPENSDELAAAIATLVNDGARREAYGRAARERVETSYSWASAAERWAAVLENSIAVKDKP